MKRKKKASDAEIGGVADVRRWRKSLMRDAGGTVRGLMEYLDRRAAGPASSRKESAPARTTRKRRAA